MAAHGHVNTASLTKIFELKEKLSTFPGSLLDCLFRNRDYQAAPEIAPEPAGHGLPLSKCEAYNRVYDQPYESR
jgi:hypothetical protein